MKGLQIDFQLKRSTLLGKIMNYVLVAAVLILALTFCVYVPYKGLSQQRTEAKLRYVDAKNEYNQLLAESSDRTINDAASKEYKKDYEVLCASLGTTKLSFVVEGEEIVYDGLDENVGFYTSHQDKIKYVLNAVDAFNTYYEDAKIQAIIEEMSIDSFRKTVSLKVSFKVDNTNVTDFRNHFKNLFLSNENVPFVISSVSQTATTGIDDGLELTLFYE